MGHRFVLVTRGLRNEFKISAVRINQGFDFVKWLQITSLGIIEVLQALLVPVTMFVWEICLLFLTLYLSLNNIQLFTGIRNEVLKKETPLFLLISFMTQ